MTTQAMVKLVEAVELSGKDDGVKVIVITGAGEKAFCAGASIDQFEQDSILSSKKNLNAYARICKVFNITYKPSIAMINGYALAGGCGLAMLPTFSIASERAVFGCPEIKAVSYLRDMAVILTNTPDAIEGTRAFMEKREAKWSS